MGAGFLPAPAHTLTSTLTHPTCRVGTGPHTIRRPRRSAFSPQPVMDRQWPSQNCCRFWQHNDLIEVKDGRRESHKCPNVGFPPQPLGTPFRAQLRFLQKLRQLGDIAGDPSCLIFAERFGSPRTCRSLFLLHEAQIADNGEQLLSDGCFGAAGKIEKGIKFILVRLHLR